MMTRLFTAARQAARKTGGSAPRLALLTWLAMTAFTLCPSSAVKAQSAEGSIYGEAKPGTTVVVSSIPSVNNPQFDRLRAAIARAHKAGLVRELVTYTYFPHDPLAGIFPNSEMAGLELLNIPPAFVWRY